MELESKKSFLINTAFVAAIFLIVYIVSKFLLGFLMPFVFALLLSFLGTKLSKTFYKKIKINERYLRLCVLALFYILFILIFILLFFGLIKYSGKLLSETKTFLDSPDNIFYTVNKKINTITDYLPESFKETAEIAIKKFSTPRSVFAIKNKLYMLFASQQKLNTFANIAGW